VRRNHRREEDGSTWIAAQRGPGAARCRGEWWTLRLLKQGFGRWTRLRPWSPLPESLRLASAAEVVAPPSTPPAFLRRCCSLESEEREAVEEWEVWSERLTSSRQFLLGVVCEIFPLAREAQWCILLFHLVRVSQHLPFYYGGAFKYTLYEI